MLYSAFNCIISIYLGRYSVGTPGSLGQVNNMKSKPISNSKWQRVVFKISGAALAGNGPHNIDPKVCCKIFFILANLRDYFLLKKGGKDMFI